ncbi:hypothetical protein K1T71_005882 [Dendrolimus kikuchii]|uniref:Uncharacterized protein n=1 Tax=Dendrolimus kikuchii TaxID=765133 RepID=A0ACC1D2W2_9NEOP|nr:hypothetical protein K1T71_005882 [Dendrolimus kikuchii]
MLEAQPNKVIVSRSDTDIQILLAEEENASLKNKQVNGKPKTRRTAPIKGAAGNEMDTFKNDIKDMIQELICAQNSRMDKLESHIMEIKNQNVKIENTNHEIEKSMTFVSEQLTSLETKISGLEKDRMSLAKNVAAIQERVETFDHNLIKTSIEIRNVPKKTNESKNMLYDMILNLSKQLAMNISEFNIRQRVVVGPRNRTSRLGNGPSGTMRYGVAASSTRRAGVWLCTVRETGTAPSQLGFLLDVVRNGASGGQ